jgi:hypothetical protein
MTELGRAAGLSHHPLAEDVRVGLAQPRREKDFLDSDIAAENFIPRPPHPAHTSLADYRY